MTAAVPMARLQDVADLNPSLDASPAADEVVSFLPMAAVDAEVVDAVDTEVRPFNEVSKGYTPFITDDVLVAKITPCFENGKIAQAKPTRRFGFGSTEFHVIRTHATELDPRYLVHFLRQKHIRKDGERKMTGSAGQRRVPEHFLASLKIPLPPVPEQRRIAEILDKADALRAKRRAALAQLDTLAQSIFLDMFGDPATNPKGWEISRVGAVAEQLRGVTYAAEDASAEPRAGYLPVLRAGNIASGELLLDDLVHVPASRVSGSQLLRKNDILIAASSGSLDVVGKAARVDRDLEMGFGAFCKVLRPSGRVNPDYFAAFFGTQYYRRRVSELAAGVNINNLRNEHLDQFPLPLPPPERQAEFSKTTAVLGIHKAHQRESQRALETLFVSLEHRAFRGEL